MAETSIEWTTQRFPDGRVVPGYTVNGWSGCTKHTIPALAISGVTVPAHVDPLCFNCYAEREEDKRRHRSKWGPGRERTRFKGWRSNLAKWNAQAMRAGTRPFVFAFSLGDWADDEVPDAWRDDFFDLADVCRSLIFLMLTKRAAKGAEYLTKRYRGGIPEHIWFGVSAGTVAGVLSRVPIALQVGARVQFVSAEPLIENIAGNRDAAAQLVLLDWGITGGETGSVSEIAPRVGHSSWYRGFLDLFAPGTPAHFKQWGNFAPLEHSRANLLGGNGAMVSRAGRRIVGDLRVTAEGSGVRFVSDERVRAVERNAFELHHYLGGSQGKHAHGRTLDGRTFDGFPIGKVERR